MKKAIHLCTFIFLLLLTVQTGCQSDDPIDKALDQMEAGIEKMEDKESITLSDAMDMQKGMDISVLSDEKNWSESQKERLRDLQKRMIDLQGKVKTEF
ncbi:MAG: hypothetical protein MUC87_04970 [Bacteroidia bacterium]|jgi:hypothetical protein|nr:hypothetical protein [Bacteroidia bacterium]